MKVLYDGAIYGFQAAGGVNQYIAQLIDLAPETVKPFLSTNIRRTVNYPTNPRLKTYYFKRFCFRPGRLCFWMERLYFRQIMSRSFDVFHPSLYGENAAGLPLNSIRCPLVITVYDMIDELFPEVDPGGIRSRQKKESFQKAQALICISHHTRADLLALYPELEPKTHVIHLGCQIDTSSINSREGLPEKPYFIFVGGRRSGYKNFNLFLEAASKICQKHDGIKLVIAGAPLTLEELDRIEKLGLSTKIVVHENPSGALLAGLYHGSLALVYPSLYEGFGIPPLEAMTCGTCVIAANRSSIPEIVGDAGLLFDPSDPDGLFLSMSAVIESSHLREQLIRKGAEHVRLYSWKKTVEKTAEVYASLC